MKVLVAGASGGLGRSLVPKLIAAGHQVTGMILSESGASGLRTQGAEVVLADGLDAEGVMTAVARVRPEVVVHQMTALKNGIDPRHFGQSFAITNRLRTEGTDNLLEASRRAQVRRIVVQSYAGLNLERGGSATKSEQVPLDADPVPASRTTVDAIRYLESKTTGAQGIEGVVLRYASFYGPKSSLGRGGDFVEQIRQRKLPLIGDGAGVWSFIH